MCKILSLRLSPVCALVLIGAALLLGSAPRSAHAQTAEDALFFSKRLPATGTRLTGLAGASIGGVGDYASLYSNPAGLGFLGSSQVAGSFSGVVTQDEASYTTDGFGTRIEDQTLTNYGIGNVGLAYKVPTQRGSLVFGVALNQTRLFGRDLNFGNRNELSSISDFFLPLDSEVDVTRYAPGAAPDDLFFGQVLVEASDADFVLDFDPNGDGVIERPLSFIAYQAFGIDFAPSLFTPGGSEAEAFIPVVAPGTEFQQVGDVTEEGSLRELSFGASVEAAQGVMAGLSANVTLGSYEFRYLFEEIDDLNENDGIRAGTFDFDALTLTQRQTSDLAGFGLRAGLAAEISPQLRAGFVIETPTFYSIDEETSTELQTTFDNGDRFSYGDAAGENVGRTTFDYQIRTPWRIGAGLSAQLADLRVLVDAVFVDWTQLELDDPDDLGLFARENDRIRDEYDPVVNTRVGLEYQFDQLALRAGFAYQPDPTNVRVEQTDGESETRSEIFYTAGLGYQFDENFSFNLSWMQQRFDDRFLPYDLEDASFANEEVVRNRVLIGISYRF